MLCSINLTKGQKRFLFSASAATACFARMTTVNELFMCDHVLTTLHCHFGQVSPVKKILHLRRCPGKKETDWTNTKYTKTTLLNTQCISVTDQVKVVHLHFLHVLKDVRKRTSTRKKEAPLELKIFKAVWGVPHLTDYLTSVIYHKQRLCTYCTVWTINAFWDKHTRDFMVKFSLHFPLLYISA